MFLISIKLSCDAFELPSTKMSKFNFVSKPLTASLILLLNLFLFTALACLLEMLIPSLFVPTVFSFTKTFTPLSAKQNSSFLRFSKWLFLFSAVNFTKNLGRYNFTTFFSSSFKNFATSSGSHSWSKTVFSASFSITRLISSFHFLPLTNNKWIEYLNKPKLFFNFACSRKHFLTREKQTN